MRLGDFHYVILISKFHHYFEVNIEGELDEVIKPSNEINNGSLSKMVFTKIGGKWVSKDGDQAGTSGMNEDDEPEEEKMQDEPAAETLEDDHNDTNMGEMMTTMSPFERLMINRMTPLLTIKGTSMTCVNQDLATWTHAFQH